MTQTKKLQVKIAVITGGTTGSDWLPQNSSRERVPMSSSQAAVRKS
jgi:hypothetical protein